MVEYLESYERYLPRDVWEQATLEEKKSIGAFLAAEDWHSENAWGLFMSGSLPWAYICLATPMKYSVVTLFPEEEILAMLAFDRTRLDNFTSQFSSDKPEANWDQRFKLLAATLHNDRVSPETLRRLLEELEADWPYEEDEDLSFPDLLDDQLRDKWDMHEMPSATRAMLEAYFTEQDMAWSAEQYSQAAWEKRQKEYDDEE